MHVPIIVLAILVILFIFGLLTDPILGFVLQVLVVFGFGVWGVRTYFAARAEMNAGITPACSVVGTSAVIFRDAQPTAWRFRFFNRTCAEQFAAANPGGQVTTLYLD